MKFILLIILLTPMFLSAQELTVTENSLTVECERTLRVDGIWIDNGVIKADISILAQKNFKPITGGYGIGDSVSLKNGCTLYIREIVKYGQNTNIGHVSFVKEQEYNKYLDTKLSNLKLNEKVNIGYSEWIVKRISKDEAEFEIEDGLNKKVITLRKNDLIWTGFGAYYISDFLANASDKPEEQWTIELKEVKDYSYISQKRTKVFDATVEPDPIPDPIPDPELIIRKMKYYPKNKVNEEELKNTPVKYWVLKVIYYHGGIVRPVIEVERNGKKMLLEYDAYKSFNTEAEVMEFAKVNGVTDIVLEEK